MEKKLSELVSMAADGLAGSWQLHMSVMGAQAALLCIRQGDIHQAKLWLEGITDEAQVEMLEDMTVAGLQGWINENMVANDGRKGFVSKAEARKRIEAEYLVSPVIAEFSGEVEACPVVRDKDYGFWTHPAYDKFCADRDWVPHSEFKGWLEANRLESAVTCLSDSDCLEATAEYETKGSFTKWEPERPAGDGWFVGSIHDSDEWPVCVWLRPVQQKYGKAASAKEIKS